MEIHLSEAAFRKFSAYLHDCTGIQLPKTNPNFVTERLLRRLWKLKFASFDEYFNHVTSAPHGDEHQTMLDLLTTNETSFFREPRHFDFIREHAKLRQNEPGPIRIWSAACSTGEEPYSIAMVLNDIIANNRWQVIASDISKTVLDAARSGLYTQAALRKVPRAYVERYFEAVGLGPGLGGYRISSVIRNRVAFKFVNLNGDWPVMGSFDLIFLRNVMIYFDTPTRRRLVNRMLKALKPGGYLFTGHSENLFGIVEGVKSVQTAVYTV